MKTQHRRLVGHFGKIACFSIISAELLFSSVLRDDCSGAMLPLLQVPAVMAAANTPYKWLCYWQNSNTGLVASHEDNTAKIYNNAIAAMAFMLNNDFKRAEKFFIISTHAWMIQNSQQTALQADFINIETVLQANQIPQQTDGLEIMLFCSWQ